MYRDYLKRYAIKAGVPPIHVHDLRHSHASYLIHNNVPVTTISRRLGHANTSVTLSVYSHMYEESAGDVAVMLEKHLFVVKKWSQRGNKNKSPL